MVLSGPSGVGKDCIIAGARRRGAEFYKCVTATTRPPREGEAEGISYRFLTDAQFRQGILDGMFLEFAQVHGYFYGTPKTPVIQALVEGRDVILNIDVQGGASVRQSVADAVLIFVAPPSADELARRLRGRETESHEAIETRLSNARVEAEAAADLYDYQIVNDNLSTAVDQLQSILTAERCRITR